MNCKDFSEPIKFCSCLNYFCEEVPLRVLLSPIPVSAGIKDIVFRDIEDDFELRFVKETNSILRVVIHRNRLNPNGNPDHGYALKFCFTISGFDDETQSAIMMYDDETAGATFRLTENVLEKATSTHVIFDIYVTTQLLEFKSLNKNDPRKIKVDLYASFLKNRLKKEEIEQLGCILKNPEMEDVFTGRLAASDMKKVVFAIAMIEKKLSKLAEYFQAKYNNMDSQLPDFEVNKILNYIGLSDEVPPPLSKAIHEYFSAHVIGLDCLKTAASDFMAHILEQDYNVLNVFEVAFMTQDGYLVEKAILSFLRRFHEIIHSAEFEFFTEKKGFLARLIIHYARVYVSNHGLRKIEEEYVTQRTDRINKAVGKYGIGMLKLNVAVFGLSGNG